ncbi:hypothetical protein AB0F77_20645 [Streptomyces sp. NPDC026672]|uniref:hypothetical protein n=1 Tax=unclassified Streptomyces TaxID=2593676 RepID=UPI0033DAC787
MATARQVVISGNREIVDQLIAEWLCVPLNEQWWAAVEMALMDDALNPARLDENCLALLCTLAGSEYRRLVPLWMSRALGGRLGLLSEQTGIDATDHESPEAVLLKSEFGDKRLSFVLGGLTEQERQVLQSWPDSAAPGERLRFFKVWTQRRASGSGASSGASGQSRSVAEAVARWALSLMLSQNCWAVSVRGSF